MNHMTMTESDSDSEDDDYCTVRKARTMNHMVADDEDECDPEDEHHRPIFCTTHDTSPGSNNSGRITNDSGVKVESVMTHSFNHKRAYVIPGGIVGLDSMFSVDVFGEKRLLSNIRHVQKKMTLICNAGQFWYRKWDSWMVADPYGITQTPLLTSFPSVTYRRSFGYDTTAAREISSPW